MFQIEEGQAGDGEGWSWMLCSSWVSGAVGIGGNHEMITKGKCRPSIKHLNCHYEVLRQYNLDKRKTIKVLEERWYYMTGSKMDR